MKLINSIVCPIVLISYLTLTLAHLVTVYDHNDGQGESTSVAIQSCTTLPRGWANRVSSLRITKDACIEVHASRVCADSKPLVLISNGSPVAGDSNLINLSGDNEFNDKALALKPCSFATRSMMNSRAEEDDYDDLDTFSVSLYEFVNRKGSQVNVRVQDCTSVPLPLYKNIASVDPNGNCVRLYSGPSCTGESVQIHPTDTEGSSNLHFWNFLDKTSSVGSCAEYQLLALTLHNKLRAKHQLPLLTLNEKLNREAEAAAKVLANQIEDPRQTVFNTGILIYSTDQPSISNYGASRLVQNAFNVWNTGRLAYDTNRLIPSSFTQITVQSLEELGIGYATSAHRSVIVAKYSPMIAAVSRLNQNRRGFSKFNSF